MLISNARSNLNLDDGNAKVRVWVSQILVLFRPARPNVSVQQFFLVGFVFRLQRFLECPGIGRDGWLDDLLGRHGQERLPRLGDGFEVINQNMKMRSVAEFAGNGETSGNCNIKDIQLYGMSIAHDLCVHPGFRVIDVDLFNVYDVELFDVIRIRSVCFFRCVNDGLVCFTSNHFGTLFSFRGLLL